MQVKPISRLAAVKAIATIGRPAGLNGPAVDGSAGLGCQLKLRIRVGSLYNLIVGNGRFAAGTDPESGWALGLRSIGISMMASAGSGVPFTMAI